MADRRDRQEMEQVYSDSESISHEDIIIHPFPDYHSDDNLQSLTFHDFAEGDPWLKKKKMMMMKKTTKKNEVLLEGYVEEGEEEEGTRGVTRTKSLTGEDLDELKGCLDLGFGFNYEEIPELCNTLPALELCYSMSQRFLDEQQQNNKSPEGSSSSVASSQPCSATSSPIANWRISGPGDHPEDVKARLKFWAQAVACTVRLCS